MADCDSTPAAASAALVEARSECDDATAIGIVACKAVVNEFCTREFHGHRVSAADRHRLMGIISRFAQELSAVAAEVRIESVSKPRLHMVICNDEVARG
ncbi:MAG: hypothetical protein ACLQO1_01640 [Steroidobacteraceae bacterium]